MIGLDYDVAIEKLYSDGAIFSQTIQLTSHNAFASVEDGWVYHPMQQFDFVHQFYYGARAFMIDVYKEDEELVLLHNKQISATAGIGSSLTKTFYFADFLRGIKNLLDNNRDSIITLIIENYVSPVEIKHILNSLGLTPYLLHRDPNDSSLTFGVMRSTGQRLVVFLEHGSYSAVNGMCSTAYYKETTYSLNVDKDCIDREEGRANFTSVSVNVFILNNFYSQSCESYTSHTLGVGFLTDRIIKPSCNSVNSYAEIMRRVQLCKSKIKSNITFLAVDFIEQGANGGALKVVADLVDPLFYDQHLKRYAFKEEKAYRYVNLDITVPLTFAIGIITGWISGIFLFWQCILKPLILPHYHIGHIRAGAAQPWIFALPISGRNKRY